jgi:hypothetical protein
MARTEQFVLKGRLFGVKTRKSIVEEMDSAKWRFELTAEEGGKLRFKFARKSTTGWWTIQKRQKIVRGSTLSGEFEVSSSGKDTLKFIFSRGFGTAGVTFNCVFTPIGPPRF